MKLKNKVRGGLRHFFCGVQRIFFEEVLVLGDSHAAVFGHPLLRRNLWQSYLNVVSVGAATASGLENPNSKTQAFQKFDRALETTRAKKVIVMLGEVDTGFVIWYRAAKYGVPVGDALAKTLTTYKQFLQKIKARGLLPICVSTPLPTIQDGNDWGEIANQRRSVTATQQERTELTLKFNREMERFCSAEDVAYLNLDDASLGDDGLVKAGLLNKNALDHHYDRRVFAELLSKPVGYAVRNLAPTRRLDGNVRHRKLYRGPADRPADNRMPNNKTS